MRRAATIAGLLAALAGTPLRQAEAADDLSRSLAELVQPAHIESLDGGIGDDAEVGTLEDTGQGDLEPGSDAQPFADALMTPLFPQHSPVHEALRSLQRVHGPPDPPSRRLAVLQVFLF